MLSEQRKITNAFLAAARGGDFDALVAVLDPSVVLRADVGFSGPGGSVEVHGAEAVARQALRFAKLARFARPALVNGAAGLVTIVEGQPFAVMGFTIRGGKIAAIGPPRRPGSPARAGHRTDAGLTGPATGQVTYESQRRSSTGAASRRAPAPCACL